MPYTYRGVPRYGPSEKLPSKENWKEQPGGLVSHHGLGTLPKKKKRNAYGTHCIPMLSGRVSFCRVFLARTWWLRAVDWESQSRKTMVNRFPISFRFPFVFFCRGNAYDWTRLKITTQWLVLFGKINIHSTMVTLASSLSSRSLPLIQEHQKYNGWSESDAH